MTTGKTLRRIRQIAIILGVVLIPLMYSFFYLNAFWDPYARLDDVPVAVVNLDEGATINGSSRNVGSEICDELRENGSVHFVFTDEESARKGVLGDSYYASITIPKDFSQRIATVGEDREKLQAVIIYEANQKKNYLAAQILENAMPTIKETVNASIDREIVETLSGRLADVPGSLRELEDGLSQLDDGARELQTGTAQLASGSTSLTEGVDQMAAKVPALVTGANALRGGALALHEGAAALDDGARSLANGADSLSQGVDTYVAGVGSAKSGAASLSQGVRQYTDGVSTASGGAGSLYQGIAQAGAGVDQMVRQVRQSSQQLPSDVTLDQLTGGAAQVTSGAGDLKTGSDNLKNGLTQFQGGYEQALNALVAYRNTGDEQYLTAAISGFQQLDSSISDLKDGADSLSAGAGRLQAGAAQVEQGTKELTDGMKQVRTGLGSLLGGLEQLQAGFGTTSDAGSLMGGTYALRQGLGTLEQSSSRLTQGSTALESGLSTLSNKGRELSSGAESVEIGATRLAQGTGRLSGGASQLYTGTSELTGALPTLTGGVSQLQQGSQRLTEGASALDEGAGRLEEGLATADRSVTDAIREANGELGKLNGLSAYAEAPVTTATGYVQPVANYGSAFAPYFMCLSLWVGGLLIFFGIYLDYNRKINSLTKDSPRVIRQALLFGAISVAQGVALAWVIRYGLHITVNHPLMLYLSCILVAWTFTAIIQFCIVHLGDIGKLVAMLLLILQLTSCAGTFPLETQAPFFQIINKFLPMTYATQLFKEAISGSIGANAYHNAAVLLGFFGVFFALTLLFSVKAIHRDVRQGVKRVRKHLAHEAA